MLGRDILYNIHKTELKLKLANISTQKGSEKREERNGFYLNKFTYKNVMFVFVYNANQ